jgi:hypothetical protein
MVDPNEEEPSAGPAEQVLVEPERRMGCLEFPVRYPVVFNPELMPGYAIDGMERSWARRNFLPQPLEICHLFNVYTTGDGLIFDSDLRLIVNASPPVTQTQAASARRALSDRIESGLVSREAEPTVIASCTNGQNYGHYMLEMLPIAIIGDTMFSDRKPKFLLPWTMPAMADVIFRTLALVRIDPDRVIIQKYGDPVLLKEAFTIRGLTAHGTYLAAAAVQAAEWAGRSIPPARPKKIFVSRVGDNLNRRLLNQVEVEDRLAAKGFTIVDPGSMNVEEQIAIFKGADLVVGTCGAAMTNIVFCKPGTGVVSLVPAAFPDTFFWFIATHRTLPYMEIRGDQSRYDGEASWNAGFIVSEEDIRFLEDLNKETVPDLVQRAGWTFNVTFVHVEFSGFMRGFNGGWAGQPGSKLWIDGIAVLPPPDVATNDMAIRIIRYDGTESEWIEGGRFAGTRGNGHPILGFRLRLQGEAVSRCMCVYEASFTDGTRSGLCLAGELCSAASAVPIEALKVEFLTRTPAH